MRTTIRTVNAALSAKGYVDELQRGDGYFYFVGPAASTWYSSSVAVYRLSDLTVDQWIAEYERLVAENQNTG